MRSFLSIGILVLMCFALSAQDIEEAKKVPTTYDRSSLAVFFLDFGSGNYYETFKGKLENIYFSDKYDNNNYGSRFIPAPYSRASVPSSPQDVLLSELAKQKAGQQIMAKWYSRQADGTMSLDLVRQRGRFSATDEDFFKAQSTKRGNAALEDFGNRLVNLSYVLIIDVTKVQTMSEVGMGDLLRGYQATAVGYLYKMKFDPFIQDAFYETWIYEDDSDQVKAEKRKKFEQLDIPLTYVTQKTAVVTASQPKAEGAKMFMKSKSDDELLQDLAQKCYDEVIYLIERDVEEFKVKTPIHAVRPIRVKIGLKEGLKTDYRFFVYEFVYNQKTGKPEPKQRGVIRAKGKSKIVDNRKEATGDMETSQFYQVAGRKLEPGFTLQQQNDLGIEALVGGEVGTASGLHIRADYRLGRFIGVRAFYAFAEVGVSADEFNGTSSPFLSYGGGIAKGFQLMRNVELRPYFSLGVEQTTNDNVYSEAISTLYLSGGANVALNLKHNIQFVGGFGFNQYTDATDSDGNSVGGLWDDYFDRSGPAVLFGIKIML
jgi:hypothetical protein